MVAKDIMLRDLHTLSFGVLVVFISFFILKIRVEINFIIISKVIPINNPEIIM